MKPDLFMKSKQGFQKYVQKIQYDILKYDSFNILFSIQSSPIWKKYLP